MKPAFINDYIYSYVTDLPQNLLLLGPSVAYIHGFLVACCLLFFCIAQTVAVAWAHVLHISRETLCRGCTSWSCSIGFCIGKNRKCTGNKTQPFFYSSHEGWDQHHRSDRNGSKCDLKVINTNTFFFSSAEPRLARDCTFSRILWKFDLEIGQDVGYLEAFIYVCNMGNLVSKDICILVEKWEDSFWGKILQNNESAC